MRSYVKSNKNDFIDAEAIAEAVTQHPGRKRVRVQPHILRIIETLPPARCGRLPSSLNCSLPRKPARINFSRSAVRVGRKLNESLMASGSQSGEASILRATPGEMQSATTILLF